jgi:MFS family permease
MHRRTIHLLRTASALGGMGYGVMFTMLDDYRNQYGISESKLGLIVGIGFVIGFISQIFFAPYADKGHAKQMVLIGIGLQIVGALLMAFGQAFAPLLIGRLLMGLGGGSAEPALRRVIILSDPTNMGHNLGLIVSAGVAGFTAGPIVSAITVDTFGLASPFLIVVALFSLVGLGLSRLHVEEANSESAPKERLAFDLLRIRPLAGAIVIGLALYFMIGTFDALWSVMMDDMSSPTWVANLGISLFALPMIFLAPRGGRLTQKYGPYKASIAGLTLGALAMASYGVLSSAYVMLGVGVLHGIIDGLTITGGSAAIALVAPKERLASAQGLYGGLQTLTGGIAAALAGWVYGVIGRATFVASALVMLMFIAIGAFMARDSLHITGAASPSDDALI